MPELFDKHTNKRGLIVYGGEASDDYGIVVAEAPLFERAKRRATVYNVPGRNGSIVFQENAYDDVQRTYNVWLAPDGYFKDLAKSVNEFEAWLYSQKGYQRLEDSFEPDTFRLAYYNGGQSISNELTQYGKTTLTFMCRPERFYKTGETEYPLINGDTILNPTRFIAKPLIYLAGSGSISLSIGGVTIVATVSDYIYIDCERMNAYRLPTENKNNQITGSFPTLKPGSNGVVLSGTVSKATIIPKYYTI